MKKIAIVGATGFTGRLTVEKLLGREDTQGLRVVLGGRNRTELERLSMELGRRFKRPLDVGVFDFGDRPSLRGLIDNSAVVVNCAAPYAEGGINVLGMAVTCKVPLIDASNEAGYLELCAGRNAAVRDEGVSVIQGVAVEPGVADLAAAAASKGWEPVVSARVLYVVQDLEAATGLRASLYEGYKHGCRALVNGTLQPVKPGSLKHAFTWPGGAAAGKNVAGGEALLLPRTLSGVRDVCAYRTQEGFSGLIAGLLASPVPTVGLMMLAKWAREDVRPVTDRSRFVVVVELESAKQRRFAIVQGSGLYETSAKLLAEAAVRLCGDGAHPKGVLSPAQAFPAGGLLEAVGLEVQTTDAPRV